MSVYDKSGQRIFFQREGSTYGKTYDPESDLTAFTAVDADYPHWRRMDIIEDTFDVPIPFIEKLKKYDVPDSKHASAIVSGNYEPVELTFEMAAQGLEFLPCAVGSPSLNAHGRAMVQSILCVADSAGSLNSTYFFLDAINTNVTKHYLIWIDVNSGGSAPTVTGINAANRVEVDIATGAADTAVATAVASAINGLTEFTATATNATVTVTAGASYKGACQMMHDGASGTGFTFGVVTWGSTSYDVTELLSTDLPSFTIHVEVQNNTSAEDKCYDLFGCVVESISVNLTYGDKVGTVSLTMKCPYGVEGYRCTNPPPRKYIDPLPAMSALQESAQNRLLFEDPDALTSGSTTDIDRTPQQVDSVVLTITNNVNFKGDISKRYLNLPIAGKREITLQIVGETTEKELFQYFLEAFTNDGTDWYPSSANGRLRSVWKVQRDATYDYIMISFYNWSFESHNFSFVSVDDAVHSVDIVLTDGSGDSNGRIINDFDYISYIDETVIIE